LSPNGAHAFVLGTVLFFRFQLSAFPISALPTLMDYSAVIAGKRTRFADLEDIIGRPTFYDDAKKAGDMLREHRSLQNLLTHWDAFEKTQTELAENRVMAKSQEDKELAEMAAAEIPILEQRLVDLEKAIQESILPPDPLEGRDVILEIRAGTGGDEASLFAADLLRMYSRFAETVAGRSSSSTPAPPKSAASRKSSSKSAARTCTAS
jgi:protein subunit release factor A